MSKQGRGRVRGLLAFVMIFVWVALCGAETRTTPVQAAGGGQSDDEYARRSDLGFQWNGDVRVRYQLNAPNNAVARNRLRARLRIGATGRLGDRADWGLRLETAPGNPISGNVTLAGGDANGAAANVGIGLAYLGFRPHEDVRVTAGKMRNPYWASEMLFDSDLQPPGVAVDWTIFHGSDVDVIKNVRNVASFWLVREAGAVTNDPWVFSNQLSMDIGPVRGGIALHYFGDLNSPGGGQAAAMAQAGNQLYNGGTTFIEDEFAVIHGKLAYPFEVSGLNMQIGGDIIYNATVSDHNFGWEARYDVSNWGKQSKGKAYILIRDVNQNATFSPWADSDLGGGTGLHSGVEAGVGYPIAGPVNLNVTYFRWDRFQPFSVPGGMTNNILQVDLKAKI